MISVRVYTKGIDGIGRVRLKVDKEEEAKNLADACRKAGALYVIASVKGDYELGDEEVEDKWYQQEHDRKAEVEVLKDLVRALKKRLEEAERGHAKYLQEVDDRPLVTRVLDEVMRSVGGRENMAKVLEGLADTVRDPDKVEEVVQRMSKYFEKED